MSDRLRGIDAIGKTSGVSPANFAPELRAQMSLPPKVIINDLMHRICLRDAASSGLGHGQGRLTV
ncbi:MAG: hypothetical protein Q7O66_13205 [Dehalococcoidia bacterium]|nr:hypothetical protein [Dehalococcoidia bacterium]